MSAQIENRRSQQRIPMNQPIVLLINRQSFYATTTDFSSNGIGLVADASPSLHSTIEVHFDLPDKLQNQLQSFQFKAEVMHSIAYEHQHHIGLKLDIPTQKYLSVFDNLE